MTSPSRLTAAVLTLLIALTLPTPAAGQQDPTLVVFGLGGLGNAPTDYDVARAVDYDRGLRYGIGLGLDWTDHVRIRADATFTANDGFDTTGGSVDESVEFSRTYLGTTLQIRLPVPSPAVPYLVVGGGLVALERQAPNYSFDQTEIGARFGGGFLYGVGSSPLELFVEVNAWTYDRESVEGSQVDVSFDAGLGYALPF